jgi:uncharacterized protein
MEGKMKSTKPVDWKVRKPNYNFSDNTERYWFNGSVFRTHLANALTILFPDAEKFFVRTVKHYSSQLKNEDLRKAVLAFIGQETQHSIQHEKFWDNLKLQGYDLDSFLSVFRKFTLEFIEPMQTPEERLALTAGLEHYTALLAEVALEGDVFHTADPELRKLFEWHCAEELEHKAVAFDLLMEVNSDYSLRVQGMILASILMLIFIPLTTFYLVNKDKQLLSPSFWKEGFNFFFLKHQVLPKAFKIFLEYFDPNFHPSQRNCQHLIQKVEMPISKTQTTNNPVYAIA